MADARHLRTRAERHRRIAQATEDLWECVTRFNLAARYDELALHVERQAADAAAQREARRRAGARQKVLQS
jgi:hypothetical protein